MPFTVAETYKYWSSFGGNYNERVMRLNKRCDHCAIPSGVQNLNLKKSG